MGDLFQADPDRFDRFSLEACGMLLDYSKNRISDETSDLLMALARASDVEGWRDRLFSGEHVNNTEGRPALHMALRAKEGDVYTVQGKNVVPAVLDVRKRMGDFVSAVRDGTRTGATGERITDVVNIGIGGSDLGAHMAARALAPYNNGPVRTHFISDIDGWKLKRVLGGLSWESTLFVVSSKTFTTRETLLNAQCARTWLERESENKETWAHHSAATTANPARAVSFGIPTDSIFEFWDWVGGRYSIWSAVGLPVALAVGMDRFEEFLAGGRDMDVHFQTAPMEENMPVILALLGIWYANFFGAESHAVIPYDDRLSRLPDHLRQMDMESNGKGVDRDGKPIDYATAPVMWGGTGINSQHSFFQKFHQGGGVVPMDFFVIAEAGDRECGHHDAQLASFLAQSRAFMQGNAVDKKHLAPYELVFGNNPSNTLVMARLDARTLGSLIALYEHKIFVQATVWKINPFDQWGVELGKKLAQGLELELKKPGGGNGYDSSTLGLIGYLRKFRQTDTS